MRNPDVGLPLQLLPDIPAGEVPTELSEELVARLREGRLELPLLPDVATQVLTLARSPDVDAAKLTDVLHRDQALASHVLRVANSAAYGARVPIVSLQQAVSRLGILALRDIVVAVAVRGRVFAVPGYEAMVQRMWLHSLTTAYWAKEVARMRRTNVESAFLCGLLHDVGKPVLLQTIQDIQSDLLQQYPRRVVDSALLHFHGIVGGAMVLNWQLPEVVSEAVYYHHDYRLAPRTSEMAMVTQLADSLAYWAVDDPHHRIDVIRQAPVLEDLNFYPDDIEQLLDKRDDIAELVQEIGM